MVSRNCCDLPAVGADKIASVGYVEMDGIVNGMGLETVNQDMFIKGFSHCLIAIHLQYPLCAVAEMLMPMNQVRGKPVVHMAVGDQQGVDCGKVQSVLQCVGIGIRRKVNQQAIVQKSLCPGAQIPSPRLPGMGADRAGAEQSRPALSRCCSHI